MFLVQVKKGHVGCIIAIISDCNNDSYKKTTEMATNYKLVATWL